MISFYLQFKRALLLIPKAYKKTSILFLVSSIVLLILDIFSIFLLIPLLISFLDPNHLIDFYYLKITPQYKSLLALSILFFFLGKNQLAILLNKKQAKVAFNLSSEFSMLLAQYYILGNYDTFKKQKKSSIIKDIIFVSNDFVSNILLSINSIFSESLLLLVILALSLFYYPISSIIIIILLAVTILIFKRYNYVVLKKINKNRIQDYDSNINNLTNLINGYLSIKSSNLQNTFLNNFKKSNQQLNSNYAILHAIRINTNKQTEIIMIIILCGIYMYLQLIPSQIDLIPFLSLFTALLFKAIPSINKLNISIANFNSHLYALDLLEKKLSSISNPISNTSSLTFESSIQIKNISFAYEQPHYLFKDFSLTIQKGDYIGIIGKSGIGKTTLLNIIAKLISTSSGEIYLDNTLINDSNKYSYFNLITYLTQKPFIYEGSILDNILLSNNIYKKNKLDSILKALDLDIAINKLPNKIDSYIGIEGNTLSGGQLQRLCIARALMNAPKILILDEATSNLDKGTEKKVLIFLKKFSLQHNTTIISISHHIHENENLYNSIINLNYYEN